MTEASDESWAKEYRDVTITTSDGSVFSGKLNIGNYKTVADLLKNSAEKFIILSDALYRDNPEKVVIINKRNIICAEEGEQ